MSNLLEFRFFVEPSWMDNYGHMTATRYVTVFDDCSIKLLKFYGLGKDYQQKSNCGFFTVDLRTQFLRELKEGEPLVVTARIVEVGHKKVITYYEMIRQSDNILAATHAQITVHVDLQTRRSIPMPETARVTLEEALQEHSESPLPGDIFSSMLSEKS
ncbi:MAG: thioesterase [Pseudomonas sp.]|uniref:acyl-CoA thioesterase n=1 Tax=Pseudomonas TaxID=286 RepID=UPI0018ABEC49|nr:MULTISPECIES: thioesterase family protein [Pseudomonas]MBF8745082.1 thioesterase family protein [Pseudomonas monteilii]MPS98325.1 thioesterase [Pseudomonas sp.]